MNLKRRPTAVGWENGGQPLNSNFTEPPADATRSAVRETVEAQVSQVSSAPVAASVEREIKSTPARKATVIGLGDAVPNGGANSHREHPTVVAPALETEYHVHRGFAKELTALLVKAGMNDLFANWIGIGQHTPEVNREMVITEMKRCGLDAASIAEFRSTGLLTHLPTIVPQSGVLTQTNAPRTGSPTMPPPASGTTVVSAPSSASVVLSDDAIGDGQMIDAINPRSNTRIMLALALGVGLAGAGLLAYGVSSINNNVSHFAPSHR